MGVSIQEKRNGKRIQSDDEIMFVGRSDWERLERERDRVNAQLDILTKQLDRRLDLVRNAHKLGLVQKNGTLDYDKFVIYDSVDRGMSLKEAKKRVMESNPQKDERAITLEYNRYTVLVGVRNRWDVSKIHQYLRAMGSAIERSVVERYVSEFRGNRGRQ